MNCPLCLRLDATSDLWQVAQHIVRWHDIFQDNSNCVHCFCGAVIGEAGDSVNTAGEKLGRHLFTFPTVEERIDHLLFFALGSSNDPEA